MVSTILTIAQVALAVLLTVSILVQARGSGLGTVFGGEGNVFRTKRGIEKKMHNATIILAILFFGVSLANALF